MAEVDFFIASDQARLSLSAVAGKCKFGRASFIAVSVGDFISCERCGNTQGIFIPLPMRVPREVSGLVGQDVMVGDL